jgi:hypothetical protein
LPIQRALISSWRDDDITLLGSAGVDEDDILLAGAELPLTLFFQNQSEQPPLRHLYISLLDGQGKGAAGWEGWPLPDYPTHFWPPGAVVQTPASFFLPATLSSGTYQLVVGLLDPVSGAKSPFAALSSVQVRQRAANFTPLTPPHALTLPAQFGTHALLLGYDLHQMDTRIELILYWQILQSLLPPHHIFVHADTDEGVTVAQDDGPPLSADGPAPTGSWLPGEYLTTLHRIDLSSRDAAVQPFSLRVGLYLPDDNIRLPVSIKGQAKGDVALVVRLDD